ncbi:hypothetical protein BH09PSE6_BH09PSE6_24990 [soil metagenome]
MAAADIDASFAAGTSTERGQDGGTTPSKPRGKPVKPLDARSKPELYNIAKGLNINGRSTMTKEALIEAIRTTG